MWLRMNRDEVEDNLTSLELRERSGNMRAKAEFAVRSKRLS